MMVRCCLGGPGPGLQVGVAGMVLAPDPDGPPGAERVLVVQERRQSPGALAKALSTIPSSLVPHVPNPMCISMLSNCGVASEKLLPGPVQGSLS